MGRKYSEPYYPSYTQKLGYRRHLKRQQRLHQSLTEQVNRARARGLDWPIDWSEDQVAAYRRGPDAEAQRLQHVDDRELEIGRAQKLRELAKRRNELDRRANEFHATRPYPMTPDWEREYDFRLGLARAVREEMADWAAEDWQDRIKGWRRRG